MKFITEIIVEIANPRYTLVELLAWYEDNRYTNTKDIDKRIKVAR